MIDSHVLWLATSDPRGPLCIGQIGAPSALMNGMERRQSKARSEVFARVRSAIAARVLPLCPDWAAEDLEALLDRMATLEIKYSHRGDPFGWDYASPGLPRLTEQILRRI